MENRNFYNQILTEHNLHPEHKHDLADANLVLEGVNPSCGDDIVLKLIIGEKKEDALHLAELFLKMIKDSITEEEMEELDEAAALQDVAHMPARVKCAVLGWHTMEEMFDLDKQQDAKQ